MIIPSFFLDTQKGTSHKPYTWTVDSSPTHELKGMFSNAQTPLDEPHVERDLRQLSSAMPKLVF